jgi:drug/metabolite transporter (DMT)-like permease
VTQWNESYVRFSFATISVFVFFGIHNFLQELIQQEFQLYHLQLNVMLGYFEVLGVCVFTYLERYSMIRYYSAQQQHPGGHHSQHRTLSSSQQQQQQHTTTTSSTILEEGHHNTTNTSTADYENQNGKESHHNNNNNNIHNHNHNNNNTDSTTWVTQRRAPLSVYPFLTLCLLSSSALSNMSLNYINFPTKVVFRSCKLLPTMVIATVLHPNKKKFSMVEYICATIVCIGLICFGMAEFQTRPTFHPVGIVLVSLSVFADALLPNAQEKVFIQYQAPRSEVTFYTNLFTLMIMTLSTYASGDLLQCFRFMSEHSTITIYIWIYTIISYIAISCHMNVVQMYGGVAAVLVATGRKAMTLMVSFLLFPKEYTIYYPIGTILVLSGLTWASLSKVYHQNSSNNNKKGSHKKTTSTTSSTTTTTTSTNSDAGIVLPLLQSTMMKSRRSDIINDDDDNGDDIHHHHTGTDHR